MHGLDSYGLHYSHYSVNAYLAPVCSMHGLDSYGLHYSHYSVNACLAPVCSMHGLAVTTVEGIGSIKHGLHPVQVGDLLSIIVCAVIAALYNLPFLGRYRLCLNQFILAR
ncbi:hypothetical protein DPMN_101842 [Dreissena polymorpha]|uniref:Uncharacterized protein n=1 Tax=Dreissena polymorpha TaxID=45954 RepID=A0A9D4R8M8_DREPO|nr:hypothetical protein DPMN_101842 [Dreissena polymorpha]